MVKSVLAGGPADKAGLKAGDRIETAKGKSLEKPDDLLEAVEEAAGRGAAQAERQARRRDQGHHRRTREGAVTMKKIHRRAACRRS